MKGERRRAPTFVTLRVALAGLLAAHGWAQLLIICLGLLAWVHAPRRLTAD
jgi:hypothetical protein